MRPVHAIKWTLTSQAFRGIIQLLQLFFLAKILGPAQYCHVALAVAFTNFALIFSDLGLTAAYIQNQKITPEQRNTLFTLNVALAIVIFFIIIVFSADIAIGLGVPTITPLITLTAPVIIISALGQQVRASAEKILHFRPLAINEMVANAIGFIATISLASSGAGAISIIWGTIVYSLINTAIPWFQFPDSMKPKIVKNLTINKNHLRFGLNAFVNGILNSLILNSDLFLSSRFIGESSLGAYSLPRNLTLQVQAIANPPLNRAAFPIFSKIQNEQNEINQLFKAITSIAMTLNTPLYLTLFFYAESIVNSTLGDAWSNSITLLQIFSLWGLMRTCLNPPGTLLLALNKAHVLRNWNIIVLVLICLTTVIAAPYGPTMIGQSLTVMTGLQVVLIWWALIRKSVSVGFLSYVGTILLPVVLGVVSIGGVKYISPVSTANIFQLSLQILFATILYFVMAYPMLRKNISKLK